MDIVAGLESEKHIAPCGNAALADGLDTSDSGYSQDTYKGTSPLTSDTVNTDEEEAAVLGDIFFLKGRMWELCFAAFNFTLAFPEPRRSWKTDYTYQQVWRLIPQLYLSSLFPQFNEGITRARKCRAAKPREARAAAWEEKRENLFFRASLVSRLQSLPVVIFVSRSPDQLHIPRQETLLKFWLNPGLSLTIFRGTGPRCLSVAFCWAKWITFVGASEALHPVTRASHLIAPRKLRFSSACYLRYNIQILKGSVTFSSIFLKLSLYAFACRGCREVILIQTDFYTNYYKIKEIAHANGFGIDKVSLVWWSVSVA